MTLYNLEPIVESLSTALCQLAAAPQHDWSPLLFETANYLAIG